jgi:hypothetical protein
VREPRGPSGSSIRGRRALPGWSLGCRLPLIEARSTQDTARWEGIGLRFEGNELRTVGDELRADRDEPTIAAKCRLIGETRPTIDTKWDRHLRETSHLPREMSHLPSETSPDWRETRCLPSERGSDREETTRNRAVAWLNRPKATLDLGMTCQKAKNRALGLGEMRPDWNESSFVPRDTARRAAQVPHSRDEPSDGRRRPRFVWRGTSRGSRPTDLNDQGLSAWRRESA